MYSSGTLNITTSAIFIENTAMLGGAIKTDGKINVTGQMKLINNTAWDCGGAMYIKNGLNIYLNDISAISNSNSALCIFQSNVIFRGRINISNNTGREGGGIKVIEKNSHIYFTGSIVLYGNKAGLGGAIYLPFGTELTFSGDTLFSHNTAVTNGGAIYSVYTNIIFDRDSASHFKWNTAENGGAIYLSSASILTFEPLGEVNLSMSFNHVTKYGGGMYNKDIATANQCSSEFKSLTLPYCFMRFISVFSWLPTPITFSQRNNSADKSGDFLYGGLLDRCQWEQIDTFDIFFRIQKPSEITSEPYQLCLCEKDRELNCTERKIVEIFPGQKFHVSLIALDQTRTSVTTKITAVSATSRLNSDQSSQTLEPECSKLWYNLYSTQDTDQLILYPDGPCRDTGLARVVVNVRFKPCPDGFMKSGDSCVCEERLNEYNASCTINDNATISRKAGSEFWVQGRYDNGTYQGLILFKTCPRDYCKTGEVTLTSENPDTQCDLNRSGLLCGGCATNHSLMLGSSRCHVCPNTYLALLLPFAAAGIALVVFLSILRLTVATGMINSVILYANFVQINRSIFLPTGTRSILTNILTVFIAWLNLDLGFETCFYDGMTAYAQTWLQFAFPLYVWILMGLIIVTCRYSVTLSKLIGHNPIAVLATLLLMSYNKVLKIMIDVYSFARLDFPQQNTRLVWLKDGNVIFWGSEHLPLTVVTSLVLVFIFLPYTLLLLLGYKLYGFSGRKGWRWLNRLKPLLDSYYAPYNTHTRYWTGFLLLVRCVLYSVFLLGDTHKSLATIIITFTALVSMVWIFSKVYISRIANTVEVSVYLNLIAMSYNSMVSAKLFNTLVALVFVTMLGIIIYHFHLLYIAQSAMWTKMKDWMKHIISKPHTNPPPDTEVTSTPHNVPSTSVIELREPLLDN